MQYCFRNFISVFGNDAVQATHREVIRRLRDHSELNLDTAIGEVLYGLAPDVARLSSDKITANWAQYSTDYGDDDILGIDSGGNTPDQLLIHIVWFYSKIDPNCVLHNMYHHTNTNCVGSSYRFVKKHGVRIFDEFKLNDFIIYDEEDIEEVSDEESEKITWEQFWDIQTELDLKARTMMLTEYPELKHYFPHTL